MLISIVILFLLVAAVSGLALYPKSAEKENGVVAVVDAIMLFCCYTVLSVWLSDRVIGRVHMSIVLVCLLPLAAGLWYGIWRRRRVQALSWKAMDVAGIVIVLAFAAGVALHVFTPSLQPRYGRPVGAEQFLNAMRLMQYGSSHGTFSFSAGIETLFIGVLAPFLTRTAFVQSYLAAEVFLRLLEAGVFYAAVRMVSERKLVRYAAPAAGVCYFFGYPAISLLWANYEYWNAGAILFLYGMYVLIIIGKKGYAGRHELSGMLCLVLTGICCGGQYAAYVAPAFACSVTGLWLMRGRGKHAVSETAARYCRGVLSTEHGRRIARTGMAIVLVLCDLLAVLWFYRVFFVTLAGTAAGYAKTEGIYRSMYGDLLFFVPVFLFVTVYVLVKKKGSVVFGISGVVLLAETIALYVRWYQFSLGTYYYFLNYYILWAFGWILAVVALELTAETKQLPVFVSYAGMIAAIAALTLTDYDYYMWHHNVGYNQPGVTKNFFSLYRQSADGLLEDYGEYRLPEGFLDTVSHVAEMAQTGRSAIVTADEALQYWNDGVLGVASREYRLDLGEFPDVIRQLEANQVDAVVTVKTEDAYTFFAEYYRYCQVLYENGDAAVYGVPEGGWTGNQAIASEYAGAKKELFSYVAENCTGETVPLMADRSAYVDYIMYENLTGIRSTEFYTWHFMPVDNLKNLNEHGVKKIVLLNEDEYYQSTKDYLDRQVVVFENEAGRVLACDGTEWATQY